MYHIVLSFLAALGLIILAVALICEAAGDYPTQSDRIERKLDQILKHYK